MADETTEVKTDEGTAGESSEQEIVEQTADQEQKERLKSILGSEERESPEEKEETTPPEGEEFEEYDRAELEKELPFLKLEQFKDKSLKEILGSYGGGIEALNKAGEVLKALEEAGIKDPAAQREAILRLKAGADISKLGLEQLKDQKPKTFEEYRKVKLSELIPAKITDELGEERPLTDEERKAYQSDWENRAERIFPSHLGESIQTTESKVLDIVEQFEWLLFKLEPVFEANKDILSDDIRTQINSHFLDKYPLYAREIIGEAQKKGERWYKRLYNEYIAQTKGDEIAQKKADKILKEREEEARKRASATTETKKTKGESLHDKPFGQMNADEQLAWIKKHG